MATENSNKTLNVPNLRFPEFSKPYSQTTISKLATIVGGGTPDTTVQEYWNGGIQWFTPSEIGKNKYADKSERTISQEGLNNSSAKLLPINTILLSTRATIGESSIAKEECCTNQGFQSLIANEEIVCYEYLYYLVATLTKELIRKSCGSTFLEISANEVRKIKTFIPNLEEQSKVSSLLSLIDERIATQIKIIEKLESLIKGLCQKLTQQENPNTALNEALVCYSSTLQESSVQEAGDYPVYGATGVCGYTDTPEVDGDSILIIKDGASVGVTYYASGKYSAIGTLNRLAAKRGYSLRYLYYCLKVFNFAPYRTGLAIPHIYFRDYGKAKVWCPSLDEQQRIADSLSKVEQKIAIEKSLLEQLYSQKRFLLQAMFI